MIELTPFPGQPVLQALRALYVAGDSADVRVQHAGGTQRFRVAGGELLLRVDDPLAVRLAAAPERDRPALLLHAIERWSNPRVESTRGPQHPDPSWAATCPTSTLFLIAATDSRTSAQLLEILGGDKARFEAAATEEEMMRLPGIEPEDAFLFSRLTQPVAVGELLVQSALPRDETLARLCRLRAVGLVGPPSASKAEVAGGTAAPKLLQRIAEDLEARPVRWSPEEQRKRVGTLLTHFGGLDHYELLGVEPGANDDEVHRGFVELGRLVHPSHAGRLEIASGPSALGMLFDRAVEAYVTLCDPQKRVAYNAAMGLSGMRSAATGAERDAERVKNARRSYDLAGEMVLAEDYHFAIEMLKQAVTLDPRAEYYALLASCQAKNANWLAPAAENARQAVARKPNDPGYHCLLAKILEESGDGPGAIAAYQAALQHMSDHPDARAGLERLAVARREAVQAESGGGVLGRLRAMLKSRS